MWRKLDPTAIVELVLAAGAGALLLAANRKPTGDGPVVMAAKLAFAAKFGVPVEAVEVTGKTATDWPTPELGCPSGDMVAHVITPGFAISMKARPKDGSHVSSTAHTNLSGSRVLFCGPIAVASVHRPDVMHLDATGERVSSNG